MVYHHRNENIFHSLFPKTTNFVRFVFRQECDADWWIYIETAIPAAIKLAFTVSVLDLNDLIRGRGEAIVRDAARAARKRGGKFRRGTLINEVPTHERYSARGLQFLIKITEPIEKIGFRWLLYAATEQFFADWQMLIERSGACGYLPERGPLTRTRTALRQGILPGGQPIHCDIVDANRAGWASTTFTVNIPDGRFMLTVAIDIEGPAGGIEGMYIRAVSTVLFLDTVYSGPKVDAAEGEKTSVMANFHIKVPSFATGVVRVELAGPAVPVGLASEKAFWSIFKTDGVIGFN